MNLDIYNNPDFVKKYFENIKNIDNKNFYDRLAVISLLPSIKNKKILDAGCGPGIYSEWLVSKGAEVTAIDFSAEMLKIINKKLGKKIRLFQADLNERISFLENNEFDLILSTMILQHIKDWSEPFSEFNRILKPGGEFIFSTIHPFADITDSTNYFEIEKVIEDWYDYGIALSSYRRPLEYIFRIIKNSGFSIIEMIEPKPENLDDSFSTTPWFICFKLKKIIGN